MAHIHSVTLFSFDSTLNFFKSLLATHYVAYSFFLTSVCSEELKETFFPQIFRFDSGSSIKLVLIKLEKIFPLSMVRFFPGKTCHYLWRVKTYQLMQLCRFHRTKICERSNEKLLNKKAIVSVHVMLITFVC